MLTRFMDTVHCTVEKND